MSWWDGDFFFGQYSDVSRVAETYQVFPFKSEKKTPLVQKDTRGRPTLKTQQERGSESQSAVVDSQESSFQLPRHSSFTPAMSNHQRPALQRSRSTSSRGKKDSRQVKLTR
ncbi:hypothetical protein R6Q59_034637 [Mikania micrantha]